MQLQSAKVAATGPTTYYAISLLARIQTVEVIGHSVVICDCPCGELSINRCVRAPERISLLHAKANGTAGEELTAIINTRDGTAKISVSQMELCLVETQIELTFNMALSSRRLHCLHEWTAYQ